ncbi:MAG: DUF5683 domain-containing protein [Balneolales bacterium]|nr:DUF5683 domain-containing protein [Balneolales bacterium]
MTRFKFLFFILLFHVGNSQAQGLSADVSFLPNNYEYAIQDSAKPLFPDPNMVMRRSLIVPGWGQVINKQAWKIPIIYGLLGGLTFYSAYLTILYHDYRAAYYNLNNPGGDFRFGATPASLAGLSSRELRSQRDFYRNRRDLVYVGVALAHILNVVDAYVYAHLRSFDVSDDLSFAPTLKPEINVYGELMIAPTVNIRIPITR